MAIVIQTINPALLGHIVVVLKYDNDAASWEVEDTGGPVLGTEFSSGMPILTRNWMFSDRALQPLRGKSRAFECSESEVCRG
ncbi:hypothetical protein QZN01_20955 [Burkholderia cenocepacia]|uniref:hypothetical protein n=1 Tax=Burkholderia cenocepacia TaxID=95486 RepID=UPI002656907C|nr:hypothetical protein [Burkholderia cenocepacia]MDN7825125.1 hypothetical protein [Burkholderia cenocepacia]